MNNFFGDGLFEIKFDIRAMGQQFDQLIIRHSKDLSNMLEKAIAELIKDEAIELAIKNEANRIIKTAISQIATVYANEKIYDLKLKFKAQMENIAEKALEDE